MVRTLPIKGYLLNKLQPHKIELKEFKPKIKKKNITEYLTETVQGKQKRKENKKIEKKIIIKEDT